jgi:broad specificity phosphatase PhoE
MTRQHSTIYLIRHGEVHNPQNIIYGRQVDVSLSPLGLERIEKLAQQLKSQAVKPKCIYTSPLKRTVQSAQKIAQVFGQLPILKDNKLLEVDSQGLENKTISWLRSVDDPYGLKSKDFSLESPATIVNRMTTALNQFCQLHQGKTIFVVTHGDPIAFVAWKLIYPQRKIPPLTKLKPDHYLNKSEAWKLVFNHQGLLTDQQLIRN